VSDLHQIVELYSSFDKGIPHSGPVNTRIGTDLYGITNDHTTDLGDFTIRTIWEMVKAKPISANDGPAMDDNTPPKGHLRIEADIGIQDTVSSDLTGFTNICSRIHCNIISQAHAPTNHDIGTHVDTSSQGHLRIDNGTSINTPRGRARWEKVLQKMDEAQIGICDTNSWTINWYMGRNQHCGST
jgi:hypothetical protein